MLFLIIRNILKTRVDLALKKENVKKGIKKNIRLKLSKILEKTKASNVWRTPFAPIKYSSFNRNFFHVMNLDIELVNAEIKIEINLLE